MISYDKLKLPSMKLNVTIVDDHKSSIVNKHSIGAGNQRDDDDPSKPYIKSIKFMNSDKKELDKKMNVKKLPREVKRADGLSIVPFPTSKSKIKQRKQMSDLIIPTHPSSVIINGRSGSGKSNLMVNLLCRPEFYGNNTAGQHYFDKIYMFSPTANSGDDLCEHITNHCPLSEDDIYNDFDTDKLMSILDKQKEEIEEKGIENSDKILIILDDIQSDQKFLRSKAILKLFIMNRHFNVSTWLCSQSFKKTPKACRDQANNFFFFLGNRTETDLIIEAYCPPRLTKRDFEAVIDTALAEPYNFLHISMRSPWQERYRKNIDQLINIDGSEM